MKNYMVELRNSLIEEKRHMPLLQSGACMIIENKMKKILIERRTDSNKWCLPGGCQELGETFEETAIREIKEETNLEVRKEDLELVGVVSGITRRNFYPNGDEVYNNTVVFCTDTYIGTLKMDNESKELIFVSVEEIPTDMIDRDIIDCYIAYMRRKKNEK